ncbi:YdeI family protein, partial [Chloroflexota bacterium]
ERLKWLVKEGKLHLSIKESVMKILRREYIFPPDILKAINENKKACENYQNFSPAYRRIRIAYIDSARNRPDEFKKRLTNFVKKAEQNKLIGFGGIEKHY